MRFISVFLLSFFFLSPVQAQSFEVMAGNERLFIDAQFLRFFDQKKNWSLFSRARATSNYEGDNTNLFTGGYLNYTSKKGLGGTLVGRIATANAGMDIGAHFFKAKKKWMLYALASVVLQDELSYSWFSIFRFTPNIGDDWKLYNSVELFSNFNKKGHTFSVQRIRIGLDFKGYQFGLAGNFSELGSSNITTDQNIGGFIRKQF